MRRIVPFILVTGSMVLAGIGCRGRQHRPYYSDPFSGPPQAGATRAPVVTESLLTPPDSQAPEVTHAGGEYAPRASDRGEAIRNGRDVRPAPEHEPDRANVPPEPAANTDPPRSGSAMDRAPDYSWIQGRLEYSALSGGVWKVRYAPISADDEHGGSVILESAPDSSRFQAGDTVYVEGHIVPGDQRRALHNPVYQVRRMRVVEE